MFFTKKVTRKGGFFVFFLDSSHFSFKNEFLMCNAYYIIITVELRQAFFEDFFIL